MLAYSNRFLDSGSSKWLLYSAFFLLPSSFKFCPSYSLGIPNTPIRGQECPRSFKGAFGANFALSASLARVNLRFYLLG